MALYPRNPVKPQALGEAGRSALVRVVRDRSLVFVSRALQLPAGSSIVEQPRLVIVGPEAVQQVLVSDPHRYQGDARVVAAVVSRETKLKRHQAKQDLQVGVGGLAITGTPDGQSAVVELVLNDPRYPTPEEGAVRTWLLREVVEGNRFAENVAAVAEAEQLAAQDESPQLRLLLGIVGLEYTGGQLPTRAELMPQRNLPDYVMLSGQTAYPETNIH